MDSIYEGAPLRFNLQEVINKTGLEMDEYLEIYEIFKENIQELFVDLETGLRDNDTDKIMRSAHTIKGACSNIGFTDLADLAFTIQNEPENQEQVGSTLVKMKEVYQRLNQMVESIAKSEV
jgi:HPt (histidine-containing phosphotransfer) domain-containing protein